MGPLFLKNPLTTNKGVNRIVLNFAYCGIVPTILQRDIYKRALPEERQGIDCGVDCSAANADGDVQ